MLDHKIQSHSLLLHRVEAPAFTSQPLLYLTELFSPHNDFEKAALARMSWFTTSGTGYWLEQSTAPQTLGYSLADSPAGLLAWIYEKLYSWTDDYPWTDDEGQSQLGQAGPTVLI